MPRCQVFLSHSPTRDGQRVTSNHVPFYLAHQVMAEAWGEVLTNTCGGLLKPTDLGIVHVDSDFGAELFVGEAFADVTLQRIGTSSLTFFVRLSQRGEQACTTTVVLVRVDQMRQQSVPLSPAQRAALEPILHS